MFVLENETGIFLRRRTYFPGGDYFTDPDVAFESMPTDEQIAKYLES